MPDPAGGAVDQYLLPLFKPAMDEEPLPGAERGERDRGALDVIEVARLRSKEVAANERELGCGAVAIEVAECVDLFADLDVVHAGSDAVDDAESSYDGIAGRRSEGQSSSSRVIAAAWTRTSASPGPGCGVSTSS